MRPFAVMLVLAGLWPRLAAADEAPAEAQSGAALVNPLAAHSLEHLSATRDRPLFAPSRRPPPPPPPVVEAAPRRRLRCHRQRSWLLGIVADANGTLAMVRSAASDKILRARLGDDIEGWKVTQIEARSLVLAHDERSVTLADPSIHPQTEEYWGNVNPIGVRSCYDEGKRCAETLFFDYWRQHRLRIKVARIFNTYGPRMHPNDGRVVSNFIVQALLGRDITVYGDGTQTRAFCYVDDLIDGLVRLMNSRDDLTGPVNIGNPQEFTMLELASSVIDLTGSPSKVVHLPLPQDDPRQRRPDITKARRNLGWEPSTSLKEGLARTIAYFETLLKLPHVKAMLTVGKVA